MYVYVPTVPAVSLLSELHVPWQGPRSVHHVFYPPFQVDHQNKVCPGASAEFTSSGSWRCLDSSGKAPVNVAQNVCGLRGIIS